MPPSTLSVWLREARAARRAPPTFVRVEVVPPPPAGPGLTLLVRGPAGLQAEVTGLDAVTVVTVLRVVLRPGTR